MPSLWISMAILFVFLRLGFFMHGHIMALKKKRLFTVAVRAYS